MNMIFRIISILVFLSTITVYSTTARANEFSTIRTISNTPCKNCFIQTPLGGGIGSSDVARPTLLELGNNVVEIRDSRWQQSSWKHASILEGYNAINLLSSTQLQQPLITYGQHLATKTKLKSSVQLNWPYLRIIFSTLKFGSVRFTPQLELAMMDFDYKIITSAIRVGRHYHHLTLRGGATITLQLTPNSSITFGGLMSLPILDELNIISEALTFDLSDNLSGDLTKKAGTNKNQGFTIGLQQLRLDFEDKQDMPNHLYFDSGAAPIVGGLVP